MRQSFALSFWSPGVCARGIHNMRVWVCALPQTKSAEKCIAVVAGARSGWQLVQLFDVAASQHGIFRLERGDQACDDVLDTALPVLFSTLLQFVAPDIVFVGAFLVRQMTE